MIKEGLIKEVTLRKEPNSICINENGKSICIDNFILNLSLNKKIDELYDKRNIIENKNIRINEYEEYNIIKYNSGLIRYTLIDLDEQKNWSSNPTDLNRYTGIQVIEVILEEKNLISSILLEDATKLVPEGYKLIKFNVKSNSNLYKDCYFIIKNEDVEKIHK